jgi:hypothetical protein
MAQLTPVANLVCKEGTGMELGDRRELDLAAWFAEATPPADDVPFFSEADGEPGEVPQTLDVEHA